MKSKWIKAIITAVVVVGISTGGYFGYKTVFAQKATVASVQYITATARKMNLEVNVQGTGAAYAAVTKDVTPNNNGTLGDLAVKIGDTVTAGQKLFTSINDDLNTTVTTAQNSVTDASLNLTSAQNDLAAKQKVLAAAEAAAASVTATSNAQTGQGSQGNQGNQGSNQSSKTIDDYKLDVEKTKLSVEQSKLKVTNANNTLTKAKENQAKVQVTAPIGGVVTAVNYTNGDTLQAAKPVLTIVDMSSMKIKVSVDELDIEKIKLGQKAQIKFGAIKDKTYEGVVETVSQVGNTQNNVTTYDVVVAVTNPEGIKLGMNANVTIQVESKENALVIPAEALVENNNRKFVRVESSDTANTQGSNTQANTQAPSANAKGDSAQAPSVNSQGNNAQAPGANTQRQNKNGQSGGNAQGTRNAQGGNFAQAVTGSGKLVEIKTGLENENYIEVLEGLTEGQKVLITLPQTSTTTTTNSNRANMAGYNTRIPGVNSNTNAGARQRN